MAPVLWPTDIANDLGQVLSPERLAAKAILECGGLTPLSLTAKEGTGSECVEVSKNQQPAQDVSKGGWETPVLAYLRHRFGSVGIICRPDVLERRKKNGKHEEATDLLAETEQGLVVVEHTTFNFLPKHVRDRKRVKKMNSALTAKLEPDQGTSICVGADIYLDKKLDRHLHEVGDKIREAAARAPVLDPNERSRLISEATSRVFDSGGREPFDPKFTESFVWRGHRIVVARHRDERRNTMGYGVEYNPEYVSKDAHRVIDEKLPKLMKDAKRYNARPLLVVECDQLAYGASHPEMLNALSGRLSEACLVTGFHAITVMSSHGDDWAPVYVLWDEKGSTVEPWDRDRFRWAFDRMKREKQDGQARRVH